MNPVVMLHISMETYINIIKDQDVIVFLKKFPKYCPAAGTNWTECHDVLKHLYMYIAIKKNL